MSGEEGRPEKTLLGTRVKLQDSKLPINLHDLLRQRTVERDRIGYKAGWNPDAIIRTLCAFANVAAM